MHNEDNLHPVRVTSCLS